MTQSEAYAVDLYLRGDAAGTAARKQRRARDRVHSLETVATTNLTEWEDGVPLGRGSPTAARAALEDVTDWARRAGVRLHPAFGTRTRCEGAPGDRARSLVLPVVTLVVRDGDSLRGVFPHRDGDDFRTVGDALSALEAGRAPTTVTAHGGPTLAD